MQAIGKMFIKLYGKLKAWMYYEICSYIWDRPEMEAQAWKVKKGLYITSGVIAVIMFVTLQLFHCNR